MREADEFSRGVEALRDRVNARLDALTLPGEAGDGLVDPIRYALLAPGKRLRPVLCMLSAQHFGGRPEAALDPGCAVEMVHTASLILDDLPCMDDAALRRGRPTLHRRYGEDVAVLAAVALLNHAFAVAADAEDVTSDCRLTVVRRLAGAVGFGGGLVTGQIRDLRDAAPDRSAAGLQSLNHQKTGVLFVAAAEIGACAAGADEAAQAAARRFGEALGQAFQIRDDLIDARAGIEDLGKDAGRDAEKVTLVSLLGAEKARSTMREEAEAALAALEPVAPEGPLAELVQALFGAARAAA